MTAALEYFASGKRNVAMQRSWHGSTPPPPLERLLLAPHPPPLTIKSCLPAHISPLRPELFASSVCIFFPLFVLKHISLIIIPRASYK